MKRRNDLIPNLVETVKGYAKHESGTLENVVSLRNQLVNLPASDHEEANKLSNQITDSLKSIFALAENYPDLKANQNFLALQEELTNTENKIAYSRQTYSGRKIEMMLDENLPMRWLAHDYTLATIPSITFDAVSTLVS